MGMDANVVVEVARVRGMGDVRHERRLLLARPRQPREERVLLCTPPLSP